MKASFIRATVLGMFCLTALGVTGAETFDEAMKRASLDYAERMREAGEQLSAMRRKIANEKAPRDGARGQVGGPAAVFEGIGCPAQKCPVHSYAVVRSSEGVEGRAGSRRKSGLGRASGWFANGIGRP